MISNIRVEYRLVRPRQDSDLAPPAYMSEHASGMDLPAAVEAPVEIPPGKIRLIPTGFAISIPPGFEAQIRPRSGLAAKHGIGLINSPGTIDADYRGEIKVALINLGEAAFSVHRGDRIAQMVITPIVRAELVCVDELTPSGRGSGGFGHTGI